MTAPRAYAKWQLRLLVVLFAAAVGGAVFCGERLSTGADPAHAERLRYMIYLHFALAQVVLVVGGVLICREHRRWRRYYLIVAYNERGMRLNPPGICMPAQRVYRCHLGELPGADLPPADAPVLVYPMFMLSGRSSGEKMDTLLRRSYGSATPQLYYQPVLGASPWLARAAADYLRPLLSAESGVLVVAHGSSLPEAPPEPALFCRRLRELLPSGTEVQLGYFNQEPGAQTALAGMSARRVLLLPFLLTEGVHTRRDLPTDEQAAACGKSLERLPVVASLLSPSSKV